MNWGRENQNLTLENVWLAFRNLWLCSKENSSLKIISFNKYSSYTEFSQQAELWQKQAEKGFECIYTLDSCCCFPQLDLQHLRSANNSRVKLALPQFLWRIQSTWTHFSIVQEGLILLRAKKMHNPWFWRSLPADDAFDNYEIQNIVQTAAGSMNPDNSQQGWGLTSDVLNNLMCKDGNHCWAPT